MRRFAKNFGIGCLSLGWLGLTAKSLQLGSEGYPAFLVLAFILAALGFAAIVTRLESL